MVVAVDGWREHGRGLSVGAADAGEDGLNDVVAQDLECRDEAHATVVEIDSANAYFANS